MSQCDILVWHPCDISLTSLLWCQHVRSLWYHSDIQIMSHLWCQYVRSFWYHSDIQIISHLWCQHVTSLWYHSDIQIMSHLWCQYVRSFWYHSDRKKSWTSTTAKFSVGYLPIQQSSLLFQHACASLCHTGVLHICWGMQLNASDIFCHTLISIFSMQRANKPDE